MTGTSRAMGVAFLPAGAEADPQPDNMRMKILSASLLCVLLTAQTVLAQVSAPASAPAAKPQDPTIPAIKYDKDGVTPHVGFMKNHKKFVEQAKQGGIDLLFLGDSITAGWGGNGKEVWAKQYAKCNPANFGIGGDRTQHVLWRIENGELDGIKPKVIVLMIGTNNIGGRRRREDRRRASRRSWRRRSAKTGAKVLLLGVFPRGESPEKGAKQRAKITQINEIVSKLDDGKNVRYLDMKDKFLQPDGTIAKEIMPDYLHLAAAGYAIWADAMEPLLTEMMGQ